MITRRWEPFTTTALMKLLVLLMLLMLLLHGTA
jgi:hypothetical protein